MLRTLKTNLYSIATFVKAGDDVRIILKLRAANNYRININYVQDVLYTHTYILYDTTSIWIFFLYKRAQFLYDDIFINFTEKKQ